MTTVGYATLDIIPSMKGFSSALQRETGTTLASSGTKAGQTVSSKMKSSFASGIKGIAGPLTAAFAAVKVVDFLGASLDQAREAQKVAALTAQVIETTGGAANVTAAQVDDLATAISNKAGIDDEAIASGENLLLTFRNIKNEAGAGNDIFNQATQAIVDLSSAMGQDMKSSAIQLGKALNDPIKGITALSRVGVAFTDQQKEQITTLTESGDALGAQKIILAELTKEFGGAAAAQATAGDKARVAFENLEEAIGTALLPVVDKLLTAFTEKGIPALYAFGHAFSTDVVPPVKTAATVIGNLVGAIDTLTEPILGASGALKTVGILLGGLAAARIGSALISGFETLRLKAMYAGDMIKNTEVQSKALGRAAAGGAALGLLALSSQLDDTEPGLKAVTTLAGSAAAGFAVGGPWGAALGFAVGALQLFQGASKSAADEQKRLDGIVSGLVDTLNNETGAVTGATYRQLADNFGEVRDQATDAGIAVETLARATSGTGPAFADVADGLGLTTDGLKQMVAYAQDVGESDFLNTDFGAESGAADMSDASKAIIAALANETTGLTDAQKAAWLSAAATDHLKGATEQVVPAVDDLGQKAAAVARQTHHAAGATENYNEKLDLTTQAIRNNIKAQNDLADLLLQNRTDRYALVAAQDKERAGLDKITEGLNAHTKVGQKNNQMLVDAASQWNNTATAAQNAKGAYQEQRQIFVDMLIQMGKTPAAARRMADSLLDIPKVVVDARLEDKHARQQAADYETFLDKTVRPKVATQFQALGVDATVKDVEKLTKKYDLTPKKEETILKALGFDEAARKVRKAQEELHDLDGKTATIKIIADFGETVSDLLTANIPFKATGGRIGGIGTGTSDSNLIAASRGEWMIRQRAAAYYGDEFMRRLNNMQIPRFATGGLIGPPAPQRAPVSGGVSIYIDKVVAHDYEDFMRQMQRSARAGAAARG